MPTTTEREFIVSKVLIVSFVLQIMMLCPLDSEAKRVRFSTGEQDQFSRLVQLDLTKDLAAQHGLPEAWAKGIHWLSYHTRLHNFGVPYKTDRLGLVIEASVGGKYWPISNDAIAALQQIGALPLALPEAKPDFTKTALGDNLGFAAFFAVLLAIFIIWAAINHKQSQRLIAKVNELTGGKFLPVLQEILLSVAHADGEYAEEERNTIASILLNLGAPHEQIDQILSNTARVPHLKGKDLKRYLEAMRQNLNQDQISIVAQGIAALIVADGKVRGAEKRELKAYLKALGASDKEVSKLSKTLLTQAKQSVVSK